MQTSANGVGFLERQEGVVLRAYRDTVGVWTIGAGLTKASGVVTPKAGMVITQAEATNLLQKALRLKYEPAVVKAMPGARQNEFDGAISFHWNTGAIAKASWVRAWAQKNWAKVHSGLLAWSKGGGKVLPGLIRRRGEEYELIRSGTYGRTRTEKPKASPDLAKIALDLSPAEIAAARAALRSLGYQVGADAGGIAQSAVTAFQRDHELTVDGIAGRATLTTLQRMVDARKKAVTTVPFVASGTAAGSAGAADQVAGLPYADTVLVVAAVAFGLWFAWRYRDAIAAAVQRPLPRLSAFLRSF